MRNKYLGTPVYAMLATFKAVFGKYDVIHFQGLGSAFCCVVARFFGKRTVVTIHALDWEGKKWGPFSRTILKLTAWAALKFADQITVVSQVVRDHFRIRYHRDALYIPNGAVIATLREPALIKVFGLDEGNFILFLGRLTPGKGCEYLIRAFSRLKTDLKLVIAGDAITEGDYAASLKAMAGDDVIFTGFVDGEIKEELYSNARIFVQPSELEGASGVVLEAMGFGRCVLASDIPQNIEVLGDAGCYFKNGDPVDLERALKALFNDDAAIKMKGSAARGRVEKFYLWDEIASIWDETYAHV